MPELTDWQDIKALIETVVQGLLVRCNITGPPVDAYLVAESLGLRVQVDSGLKARGYTRRRWDISTVVVGSKNPGKSERKQFTLAHEIGETLLKGKVEERLLEGASNLLAISLLMPGDWFRRDAEALGYDLLGLKGPYSTASHELIALRMLDFRPLIITIFDNGRLYRRKGSYPMPIRAVYPLERQCLEAVSQAGKVSVLEDGSIKVTGWPVFKEGWKRVILKTELKDN